MEPEEKEDSTGEGSEEEPVGEDQVLDGSLQENSADRAFVQIDEPNWTFVQVARPLFVERSSLSLEEIERRIENGEFNWRADKKDMHMNIGEPAKKLHTARSRNNQFLSDFTQLDAHEHRSWWYKVHSIPYGRRKSVMRGVVKSIAPKSNSKEFSSFALHIQEFSGKPKENM
ncbi:hypothetical protein VIGAN_07073000 [Vigna angularis var. angularis]|uniref:Uncharacterized protein n=1 Tax=Vigna angularis var. angularis TaxID=157739 RepID=A0A0S3SGS9_PHAAN|nr:hypothetical protein VIGAN_07073000 [Vigna angularis var. angularis]